MTVADPLAKSYIHKDSSIPPLTEFQVKVKAFNSKGEGPFSLTAVIYSAQDGKHSGHSQTSALKQKVFTDLPDPAPSVRQRTISSLVCQNSLFKSVSASHLSLPGLSMKSELFNRNFSHMVVRNFNTP